MARKYSELRDKLLAAMTPEQRIRHEERCEEVLQEYLRSQKDREGKDD